MPREIRVLVVASDRESAALAATLEEERGGLSADPADAPATAHGWPVELVESEAGGARFEFRDVDVVGPDGSTEDGPGPDASGPSGTERLDAGDR